MADLFSRLGLSPEQLARLKAMIGDRDPSAGNFPAGQHRKRQTPTPVQGFGMGGMRYPNNGALTPPSFPRTTPGSPPAAVPPPVTQPKWPTGSRPDMGIPETPEQMGQKPPTGKGYLRGGATSPVMRGFATGGTTRPGETAIVGETVPELIHSDAPVEITPMPTGPDQNAMPKPIADTGMKQGEWDRFKGKPAGAKVWNTNQSYMDKMEAKSPGIKAAFEAQGYKWNVAADDTPKPRERLVSGEGTPEGNRLAQLVSDPQKRQMLLERFGGVGSGGIQPLTANQRAAARSGPVDLATSNAWMAAAGGGSGPQAKPWDGMGVPRDFLSRADAIVKEYQNKKITPERKAALENVMSHYGVTDLNTVTGQELGYLMWDSNMTDNDLWDVAPTGTQISAGSQPGQQISDYTPEQLAEAGIDPYAEQNAVNEQYKADQDQAAQASADSQANRERDLELGPAAQAGYVEDAQDKQAALADFQRRYAIAMEKDKTQPGYLRRFLEAAASGTLTYGG